ncbi:hypothetical protein [Streptomyces sp. st115]|uniref:hypothetical protein n=1 Tax=Streptomyces sp. st115 TaxID=1828047 RepID=UPI000BF14A0D|nr:hypothetical protein [Streptomyces sp. st115]
MTSSVRQALPESVRHGLRAIVFDTNSFPHGELDLGLLKFWGERAAEEAFEVWVPEPVMWELAEHSAASWEMWRASVRKARKSMAKAGLPEPAIESPYTSREEVMEAVEGLIRDLAPSVRVLDLDGDLATAALRDQIQLQRPAKTKGEVKTGAADSAWLRVVLRAAENNVDSFVIVGADADVYEAFESWNLSKPHMVQPHQLSKSLFVLEAPSNEVRNTVVQFLQSRVGVPLEAGRTPEGDLILGDVSGLADDVNEWELDQVRDVELGRIHALVGMNQMKVSRRGLVTAQVFLLADAQYNGSRVNEDGTSSGHSVIIPRVFVRDVLSFTLDEGVVTRARSETGQAVATRTEESAYYHEPDEAFDDFIDALSVLPGLDGDLGGDTYDSTNVTALINGFELNVTSDECGGDPMWSATLTLSKGDWSRSMTLRCEWDLDRVSYEMPDLWPAYLLVTDEFMPFPGDWAASAWVIDHVWPRKTVDGE